MSAIDRGLDRLARAARAPVRAGERRKRALESAKKGVQPMCLNSAERSKRASAVY